LRVLAVHDPPAQLREHLLAQRDMVGTDRTHDAVTHTPTRLLHPWLLSPFGFAPR
jgi:hypothetical protein